MSLDTRSCKVNDELCVWITGEVPKRRAKVIGHSERHGGAAILQILDSETGEPDPKWASFKLRGEDYVVLSTWAEHVQTTG